MKIIKQNSFIALYCIYFKKSAYMWAYAVQTYVVQGPTVYGFVPHAENLYPCIDFV